MSLIIPTEIPPPLDLGRPARRVRFALPSLTAQELQTLFCTTVVRLIRSDELFLPASPRLALTIENVFSRCVQDIPQMLRDRGPLCLPPDFFTDYYMTKFRLLFTSSVLALLPDGVPGEVAGIDTKIATWAVATKVMWKSPLAEEISRYILNCPRV